MGLYKKSELVWTWSCILSICLNDAGTPGVSSHFVHQISISLTMLQIVAICSLLVAIVSSDMEVMDTKSIEDADMVRKFLSQWSTRSPNICESHSLLNLNIVALLVLVSSLYSLQHLEHLFLRLPLSL